MNFFECKIRFEKTVENGLSKKVTEAYLVDALSFTEAEARIIEETQPFISGVFSVVSIKRENISELFPNENGDKWYKVKVNFITLDERTGAEKKIASYMLAQGSDIDQAKATFTEGMKGTMADYEMESIKETKIMDIYPYEKK